MGRVFLRFLAVLVLACVGGSAWSLMPLLYTDEQIAQSPVVVIGYWPKATFVSHNHVVGPNEIDHTEGFTKLRVTRVLRGSIAAGTIKLLLNGAIGWGEDGKGLEDAMSTEIMGDVDDVSKPCIWFLDRERSWDKKDKTAYWHVKQFQFVQPIRLLSYFQVLMRPDRDTTIAKCLLSSDSDVVQRSLHFVSGWADPWPYAPSPQDDNPEQLEIYGMFNNERPKKPHKLLGQIGNVERVIAHGPAGCRAFATAVYADLRGPKATPELRQLVKDPNPDVALVAAGCLVQCRDRASANAIAAACHRAKDGDLGCEVVLAIKRSKDRAFWAGLFEFLDCDAGAGSAGDDIRTPALYARDALRKLIGFTFPLASETSLAAWRKTSGLARDKSVQALKTLLGDWQTPIKATWSIDKKQKAQSKEDEHATGASESATVRLTNATTVV